MKNSKQHSAGCRGRGVCGHDKPSIPEQTWPQTPRPRHPHAFTLVELLVVVAILGLLVGILLPTMSRFIRMSLKSKSLAAVHMIDGAAKHYFSDFEDYPPSRDETNYPGWNGSQLIVLFLIGYGPDWQGAIGTPYEDGRNLAEDDGRAGFGFRVAPRGKVYGPYNGCERLKVSAENTPRFIDAFENPILYYRWTGSGYASSDNSDGPNNLDSHYAKNGEGTYYRGDFILISKGCNNGWNAPRDLDSDDVTNFFAY